MSKVIFVGGNKKVKVKDDSLSLKDFHARRNKVLFVRDGGGLGDILMMRMIFEDVKKLMPDCEINFAVPSNYQQAASWHPHVDEVLDSKEVDENKFGAAYDLTSICVRYEMKIRPRADRHRAEIWSAYCGFELTSHDMHLDLPETLFRRGEDALGSIPKGKRVCFTPMSNMVSKDLGEDVIRGVISELRKKGYFPFILHNKPIPFVDCPVFHVPLGEWLSLVAASDYVISVDTAAFHAANGFRKPTVAIFSWADGKVYTKFHNNCVLIQRHRDHTPGWTCGPCYAHPECPRTGDPRKPCITEITLEEIMEAFRTLTNIIT